MVLEWQKRLLGLVAGVGRRAGRRARRLGLRGTPAEHLRHGHIGSLELLKCVRDSGPPRTVYDLGANVATWTLLSKAMFPEAAVEAFEPLPNHAEQFLAATAAVPGVRLHRVALGSSDGVARLKVTSYSDAASLLDLADASTQDFGVMAGGPEVEVPLARLDRWVAEHGLPWPDLIKLDLQGYEVEALKGAPRCLENARHVLCEVSLREYYHGQPLFAEVVRFLDEVGFDLRALPSTDYGLICQQMDALFEARSKTRARTAL